MSRRACLFALLALGGPFAGSAAAATSTTITFDDLSAGTVVTNQYDTQGIDFAPQGIINGNVYCPPTIVAVGSGLAHSGNQVADTSCANGEFPDSSIYATLHNSAQNVSVYAGFAPTFPNAPPSVPVTLNGYDANNNIVATSTVTVPANQGTQTPIAISSSSPNIVAFDLTTPSNPQVQIDDLTFDNPGGAPADFTINPQSTFVQLAQGQQTTDQVTIHRINGSFGNIDFSAANVPTGVQVSFNPNPATGGSTTMTIQAAPNAALPAPGPFPSFTVTATPANSGVGPTARSSSVQVDIAAAFTVTAPKSIAVPPCSTLKVPITVDPAQGLNLSTPVTLSASGVPADDTASFSPATLAPGQTQTTLTLTSQSDVAGPSGQLTVTASSGSLSNSSPAIAVTRVPPSITRLADQGSGQTVQSGVTPQGASPDLGTPIVIQGEGFCQGSSVYFGNSLATAFVGGPGPDGLGPFGEGTAIVTSVPSLATSGQVYVVPPGGSLFSFGTATTPFTVDSYRNTDGFSFVNSGAFQNAVGGYSFGDISAVFGDAATHIDINPCWPFGNCTIVSPVPDPFALLFWAFAESLQGGQCFGFSLASQRLLHGDQPFSAFPLQPGLTQNTVWNLQGPDNPDGSPAASPELMHFIHLMHMEQLSAEALNFWLTHAVTGAVAGSQNSIMDAVTAQLNAGDHPLIELRNGGDGHVVVAYGTDQGNGSPLVGPGDRVIDVYNPNQPFKGGENSAAGGTHQSVLSTSEIVVHANGHWEYQGDFSPEWHAGPGSLVVLPYNAIPLRPTMPTTLGGLFTLLFGSAGATQVTDSHGHTLLSPDGQVNSSSTGIPGATQFAALSGSPTPGPAMFLFEHPGAYTTTVRGQAAGTYHDALFGHGTAASLTAATAAGITDGISVPAGRPGLQFGQTSSGGSGPRSLSAQVVVTGAQRSKLTAAIASTMPTSGQAALVFDASRSSVEVNAGNDPMAFTLSLGWAGADGAPQAFAAAPVHLAPGDRAIVTPANWAALESSAVTLRIDHRNGKGTTQTLRNRIRPAGAVTLAVKLAGSGAARRLTVAARLARLAHGSAAVVAWVLLRGRKLIAHRELSLTRGGPHRLRSSLPHLSAGAYTLRATVDLITPAGSGYASRQVSRVVRFRG